MVFSFSCGGRTPPVMVDMALEALFENGSRVQAMFVYVNNGRGVQKKLLHRTGTTGRWLDSDGIPLGGQPRTPENIVRSIGGADPVEELYVMPAT